MRWSQWKTGDYAIKLAYDPDQLSAFLAPMVDAGVTAFHCSTRRFWEPEFPTIDPHLNLAGWTKKVTGLPTITVGSFGLSRADTLAGRSEEVPVSTEHLEAGARAIERGDFDFVAIGRALLANPDLVRLMREGRLDDIRPYTAAAVEELA
jgi:2,4-dienoyl-CoA reductase-like NADH-dependent reductase (Old Yellow Enzyme family)